MKTLHDRLQTIALPLLVGAIIIMVMKTGVQIHNTYGQVNNTQQLLIF